MGALEQSGLVIDGARKRALAVTEKFALYKLGRDSAAVDGHERALGARAAIVNEAHGSLEGPLQDRMTDVSWMRRATSSLPVPDSPAMCTGACDCATLAIISRSSCMRSDSPSSFEPPP